MGVLSLAPEHVTLTDWRSVAYYDDEAVEAEDLFSRLVGYREANFLMTAGIHNANTRSRCEGLLSNHFYSVLSLFEQQDHGKQLRLLQLRNPWGSETEWEGAWSDAAEEWASHPELASQLPRNSLVKAKTACK